MTRLCVRVGPAWECIYCTSQPDDYGPGCPCAHAPCVHDRNADVRRGFLRQLQARVYYEEWIEDFGKPADIESPGWGMIVASIFAHWVASFK